MNHRIGVDGGGSKTEVILVDGSGAIVARHLSQGCNPSVVGREEAARIALLAMEGLLAGHPGVAVELTLLCMAGSRGFWQGFAAALAGFGRVVASDDSLPVLELATDGGPGMVLHSGTGSFVAARAVAGEHTGIHYAGGLGFLFGDPGSGYDIGRRAVARAVLELQGWAPPSGLGPLLKSTAGVDTADALLGHYYGSAPATSQIAAIAPAVLRLAAEGDAAAREAAVESAAGLLALAKRVAARLFPDTVPGSLQVGLSGSILNHPVVSRGLAAQSPFRLNPVDSPPIEGVRRALMGLEP